MRGAARYSTAFSVLVGAVVVFALLLNESAPSADGKLSPSPITVIGAASGGGLSVGGTVARPLIGLSGCGAGSQFVPVWIGGVWGCGSATTIGAQSSTAVSPRDYGAVGDGVADDTAAFAAAVATGREVVCRSGDTYLINGGTTTSTAGQVVDMTGCKLRLKNAASSLGMLQLHGVGAVARGGEWDLNGSGNAGGGYNTYAVQALGDASRVEGIYAHDSSGLCISALAVNKFTARGNRLENCATMAVYVDSSGSADTFDTTVEGNYVSFATTPSTQGIGLYSNNSHVMHRMKVLGNTVLGPGSGAGGTNVNITVRGTESVVANNVVRGSTIGISVDQSYAQDCSIVANNVQGANGGTAYGIEINGGYCTIANNWVQDGKYGITGSVPSATAGYSFDHLVVTNNVITGASSRGLYFLLATGATGYYDVFAGNTVDAPTGLYLTHDFRYALITGNSFNGSGSTGGTGVFLDTVNSDVRVVGNRFSNLQSAFDVYNATVVAQDRMVFQDNDLFFNVSTSGNGAGVIRLQGSATYGAFDQVIGNKISSTLRAQDDFLDIANNIRETVKAEDTPVGAETGGSGSRFVSSTTGQEWLKLSGSAGDNTGWAPLALTGGIVNRVAVYNGANGIAPGGITDDGTNAIVERSFYAALGYPTSALTATAAISASPTTGYLLDEGSGSAFAVFGAPSPLAAHAGTITYGIAGPLGGADTAVQMASSGASFDGGSNFDAGSANDLVVAWVGQWAAPPTSGGTVVSKIASGASSGWAILPNSDGTTLRFCGTPSCSASITAPLAITTGTWHVVIAVIDRSTNKMRIGECPLGGTPVVSAALGIAANTDFTTASPFRIGSSSWANANQNLQLAALYVGAGPGIASGLSTNLSAALSSFSAAITATTQLGNTTVTTLHATGPSRLDGLVTMATGYTAGAASSMGGFKITSLANGTASSDAAAFGQIGTAVNAAINGTANKTTKFTAANTVGNAWASDDGTTWGSASIFTITEASGNFKGFGTGEVVGLLTMDAGFSAGAAATMGSHQLNHVSNGTSSDDAAAFGQIATGVNAAVSGTSGQLAMMTGANSVGNESGAASFPGTLSGSTTNSAEILGNVGATDTVPTLLFSSSASSYGIGGTSGHLTIIGAGVKTATFSSGGNTSFVTLAMNSTKITSLANGTASSDAAAFGQITTGINAAVNCSTSNALAKFTGTNVVGCSALLTDNGTTVTDSGNLAVTGNVVSDVYFTGSTPALSSCSTATIVGNNTTGRVTTPDVTCTVGFATPVYTTNAPACEIVVEDTVTTSWLITAISPSAFTVAFSRKPTAFSYVCGGIH